MIDNYIVGRNRDTLDLSKITDKDILKKIAEELEERKDIIKFIEPPYRFKEGCDELNCNLIDLYTSMHYKADLLKKISANDPQLIEADFSTGTVSRDGMQIDQPSDLSGEEYQQLNQGLERNTHLRVLKLNYMSSIEISAERYLGPLAKAVCKNITLTEVEISYNSQKSEAASQALSEIYKHLDANKNRDGNRRTIHAPFFTDPSGTIKKVLNDEQAKAIITPCQSLQELAEKLRQVYAIAKESNLINPGMLADEIENIIKGKVEFQPARFTRTGNIREKLIQLYKAKAYTKQKNENPAELRELEGHPQSLHI